MRAHVTEMQRLAAAARKAPHFMINNQTRLTFYFSIEFAGFAATERFLLWNSVTLQVKSTFLTARLSVL
jgi:hypothetical protein